MQMIQSRRSFLTGLSATGLATSFTSAGATAGPSLETTRVRFADFPESTCTVPQFIAAELLLQDGFSEVLQVPTEEYSVSGPMFEKDAIDFSFDLATGLALGVDNGQPMIGLAGVHVGCYVLFGQEGIRDVRDLKGRRVGIGPTVGSDPHLYVSAMATYVGLNPQTEIEWVRSDITPSKLFEAGAVDAILAFPPEAQAMRRRGLGRVIVNSMADRPWSQYFCCMLVANPRFVQSFPVATKRVVRAVMKANEICISDPQTAVQMLVDREEIRADQSDDTLAALKEIPYAAWRDYDPEDTVRFFALRLHEAGMIRTSPQRIVSEGTDWSFLNAVKRELKA
jgi:NitT/TauT family transport system substrate-binding protein